MNQRRSINVGLVGGGAIARAHAVAYATARVYFGPHIPAVRLRRLAEADEQLARTAAERLGFEEWTADWEALVASPDIDAVSIATPNFLHAPMALAAAAAGKHVFCEKPLAMDAGEAERMYRAAVNAGVVHGVNFNYRKVPAVQFIARLIRTGRIGTVRHLRAVYLQDWGNDIRTPRSWKFQAARSGAGALAGVGSHLIDLSRYLVGELDRVVATSEIWVRERPRAVAPSPSDAVRVDAPMEPVDVDDSMYFLGRFSGGSIGTFEISRCATGRKNQLGLEIHGSRGSIIFDYERQNEVHLYLDDSEEAQGFRRILIGPAHHDAALLAFPGIGIGFAETVLFQVRDFLAAIAGGSPMSPDFYDGWRAQMVVDAVLDSARGGRWVAVPPLPARGSTARLETGR
ncbi:MAG: Gfo/Idh/MocA family oxidoreductase [Armatimonadota bacterium]|nr:Gfo/Idh/MocA family oxidoreductase [Armatimonadota bacterium]MDR7450636.1 Gfo/Idh/MocA family oxidoreductase [Armatimonadota bacterium]MDR7466231.1 Gfo/Idh/MocA family oxidoreductase [Armatimonadota bacterium]MDR7492952.1 Gfo/Idh/MocA family oxidoreductase [Armatimonadota bacterium]MDR7498291.1 Gfo/Idh/MocA family oxidoreductase [Armatimonadota bacterium]